MHIVEWAHHGRFVLDESGRHHRAIADLDRIRVALRGDRLGRKERLHQLGAAERNLLRLGSRYERRGLDREAERLGDRSKRIGLLVHEILELVGGGRELLRHFLPPEVRFDLSLHLVERARLFGRHADESNHVPAELALDRAGDLAGLHGEHGVVEGLHHRAARVAAEVAALRRRARILRTLLGELAELRGIGLGLRRDLVRGLLCRGALRLARIGFHCDQDVRRLPLLLLAVGLGRAVVLRLHLLRRHGNLREQGILRQHDILEFRFLGRLEGGRIGVVERLLLGRVDGDVLDERLDVDIGGFDLALLLDQVHERDHRCLRHDAAARDGIDDAFGEDLPPDALLECGFGDPGLTQQILVDVEREPVAVAKARVRGDSLEDLGVRDPEMQIGALLLDQTLAQQILHQVETHFRIVENRRVDALRASPQLFLLVPDCLGEFGLGNLAAVEFRHLADAAAAAEVVIDAEKRERNHDQRQNELRDPFVFVHEIIHWLRPVLSSPASIRAARCCNLRPATAGSLARRNRDRDRMRKGRTRVRPSNWRSGRLRISY